MIHGSLRDVHAILYGDEIYGVFATERQAQGYIDEQLPGSGAVVAPYRAFQYDGNKGALRVLLFKQVSPALYELNTDYEPEADRVRRELKRSAWEKLTAAEREAIGWQREP